MGHFRVRIVQVEALHFVVASAWAFATRKGFVAVDLK